MYEATIALLTARGVPFTIHEHVISRTFAEAEAQLPFPLERLLKTVAFKLKAGGWVLAALRGQDRVDYRKLALATGVKRADLAGSVPEFR
jgi:Cys-tRNA(Pro)/Cys-tRNA(Cys) deacylase